MRFFFTIAITCSVVILVAAGIHGLTSETDAAQNIEILSLKDMQVMYGSSEWYECETAYNGNCTPRPGLTCNESWTRRECVYSGTPSTYCQEYNSEQCTDSGCYLMIVEDCYNM